MRSTLLAAIAMVGLAGCVGGIESGTGDPLGSPDGDGNDNGDNPAGGDLTEAKRLFDDNVFPLIQKCGAAACHGEAAQGATLTRFVAAEPSRGWSVATNYTALVGNFVSTAAPILTYIQGRGHQGMADWSADEVTKITAWLDKEVALRNGQTTPPPGNETLSQATERVLAEFAGCMNITNFQLANMVAWADVDAQNNTQCRDCHVNGGEGFIATVNQDNFYNVLSSRKYYFLQYFTVDLTQGAAAAKVIINEVSMRGVATGQDPHREHPRFDLDNEGMAASQAFYDLTLARQAAGQCDPPRPFTL